MQLRSDVLCILKPHGHTLSRIVVFFVNTMGLLMGASPFIYKDYPPPLKCWFPDAIKKNTAMAPYSMKMNYHMFREDFGVSLLLLLPCPLP